MDGYTYNLGTIWNTSCGSDGVRIFYLETEPIHPTNSDDGAGPRLQEVGRYYYKVDRPTEASTNGTKKIEWYI